MQWAQELHILPFGMASSRKTNLLLLIATIFVSSIYSISSEAKLPQWKIGFRKTASKARPTFNFRKMFRSKQLNPALLKFAYDNPGEGRIGLHIFYNGKLAGGIYTSDEPTINGRPGVGLVAIKKEFRGKGLGTFLYLFTAKKVYNNSKEVLNSTSDILPKATSLWQGLAKQGFARELKLDGKGSHNRSFEFRKGVLSSAKLRKIVRFVDKNQFPNGPDKDGDNIMFNLWKQEHNAQKSSDR